MSDRSHITREYLEAFLVAVLLAVFARTYVAQAFRIPTASMEGNLLIGDHVLVNKFVFAPTRLWLERLFLPIRDVHRGDVVVFRYPEDPSRDFVKRCIGLPGDRIELRDKQLHINGVVVDDLELVLHEDAHTYPASRFLHTSIRNRDNFGPFVVPTDHYFVLGDNRDLSNDSRFWGPVPAAYVHGRALAVYWSVADESVAPESAPGAPNLLRHAGRAVLGLFFRTRWERCFRLVH